MDNSVVIAEGGSKRGLNGNGNKVQRRLNSLKKEMSTKNSKPIKHSPSKTNLKYIPK